MADLISRKAAIEAALDGADEWDGGCNPTREEYIREHMERVPAVEAVPVVHGKWILADLDKDYVTCSYCEANGSKDRMAWTPEFAVILNYCPNCGAKMDGEQEAR